MTTQQWKAAYGPAEMYNLDVQAIVSTGIEIFGSSIRVRTFSPPVPEQATDLLLDGLRSPTAAQTRSISTPDGDLVCYANLEDVYNEAEILLTSLLGALAQPATRDHTDAWITFTHEGNALTVRSTDIQAIRVRVFQQVPNRPEELLATF